MAETSHHQLPPDRDCRQRTSILLIAASAYFMQRLLTKVLFEYPHRIIIMTGIAISFAWFCFTWFQLSNDLAVWTFNNLFQETTVVRRTVVVQVPGIVVTPQGVLVYTKEPAESNQNNVVYDSRSD